MKWDRYLAQIDEVYALPPQEAETRLLQLDSSCAEEYGKNSTFYASMRNELGAFYKGQGRFEEAAACFRQAIALFRTQARPGDPALATAMNNLAGVLRLSSRPDEAEELFRGCLQLYADSVGTQHILYAAGLNNLSLVCLDRGETDQAARLQQQAADILRALPESRDELAASLINLGALRQTQGRLEEAEKLLDEALALFETELGTDTPHYHAALNGRGIVRYAAGNFSAAEADFLSAARAAEAMYGVDHYEAESARANARAARRAMKEKHHEGS